MEAKQFGEITNLVDYLRNNLIIAYFCGFDLLNLSLLAGLSAALLITFPKII
ncbi:hypothetical protein [Carboxydothermus pertinax]|uniref:hypothetical protein n=1 Tax=Carboxydothermus pertinax TaxID=870242 RepID=UPI001356592E|nr:hypothetical protein [Carboxydothermus pertinax]